MQPAMNKLVQVMQALYILSLQFFLIYDSIKICCQTHIIKKKLPTLVFHLVLQLLILFLSCFASLCQACNPIDQYSLLSLHLNLSSPPWNWSSSTDYCLWEGIKCEASGCVSHLWLPFKGFSGTISPRLATSHIYPISTSHTITSMVLFPSIPFTS